MNTFRAALVSWGRRGSAPTWTWLLLLVVGLTASACSEHTDTTGPGVVDGVVVVVELQDGFQFSQPELRIEPGTTVRWVNTTSTFHTVTPDGHTAWSEWQTASQGESFEVTFDQEGTFPYYCLPHRSLGMTGTVIVE